MNKVPARSSSLTCAWQGVRAQHTVRVVEECSQSHLAACQNQCAIQDRLGTSIPFLSTVGLENFQVQRSGM